MPSIVSTHRGGLALAVLLAACSAQESSRISTGQPIEARVSSLLLRDLSQQLAASDVAVNLDTAAIKRQEIASQALPGLAFHWATYRPQGVPHGYVAAVVGVRDDSAVSLRTAADWSRLMGSWRPSTREQARTACLELTRATGQGRDPERPGIPVSQASSEIRAMPQELQRLAIRALRDSTRVSPPGTQSTEWLVEMWVFEAGRTTRYRCELGGNGRTTTRLTALDAIEGVGWFTDRLARPDSG